MNPVSPYPARDGAAPARVLAHDTLAVIIDRLGLHEALRRPLVGGFGPVGELRVWSGGPLATLVCIGLTVAPIGLDSHMLFAFMPETSPIPHFTLDSVQSPIGVSPAGASPAGASPAGAAGAGGAAAFAFHLDLIPRVDLGAHLAYLDAVYGPLTPVQAETAAIAGLEPTRLTTRQYAIMSPWMLVHRATAEAFAAVGQPVAFYRDHWLSLVERGLPADAMAGPGFTDDRLRERDRLNRAILFNPAVDRVWSQVDRLVGSETSAELRAVLCAPTLDDALRLGRGER
jgi:hypothetical protein